MKYAAALAVFAVGMLAVWRLAHWIADTSLWLFVPFFIVVFVVAFWMEANDLGPRRTTGAKPWNN